MTLEDVFHRLWELSRFRRPPLGPEMDGFCEWLEAQGFSRSVMRHRVSAVSHFNQYLRGLGVTESRCVDRKHAERFLFSRVRKRGRGSPRYLRCSVRSFLKYLSEQGVLVHAPEASPPYQGVLQEYLDHLRAERNLSEATIKIYLYYLTPFLESLGGESLLRSLQTLSPREVQAFFIDSAKGRADTTRGQIQAALRTFLGFAAKQGYIPQDLTGAVPKVFTCKLASVPRAVSEQDAIRVLDSIDRTEPVGQRDFAIIELLHTYGVRGVQVRALRLQDIQWRQNRIRFLPVKGGREILEPLTDEVGESLLEYLRHGRPPLPYPEVFLTARPPFHPLEPTALYSMTLKRMRRAGLNGPARGPHSFRHGFATRLLKHGQPLKTIADMLGHRTITSTFIYTKVDFQMLERLGLDWPEVYHV